MAPRLLLPALAAPLLGLLAAGCATRTEASRPTVDPRVLAPVADAAIPWQPESRYEEIGGPWRISHGQFGTTALRASREGGAVDPFAAPPAAVPAAPAAVPAQPAVVRPSAPKLAVPKRRAREEARPVGEKTTRTPEELAREHFLDYPTRIKARKITLYLPPAFAREARLTGESLSPAGTSRRQALGRARLVVRELTLEGERVALSIRTDGRPDVQIMARGDVGFVAEVRGNVLREQGLRSLLITNDRVTPIR